MKKNLNFVVNNTGNNLCKRDCWISTLFIIVIVKKTILC